MIRSDSPDVGVGESFSRDDKASLRAEPDSQPSKRKRWTLETEFYDHLPRPVRVGIEATGSMQWFVNLMEELGIECLVGHPAEIRAAEPRKQRDDWWATPNG